jgi:anti-anti-sigma factor
MRVPSELFSAHVERADGVARLRLSGRFDSVAIPELHDLIGQAQRLDVVIDLGEVTFMNGAAWLAVMDFEHRVHDWGREIQLVNTPEPIRRIFELTASERLLSEAVGS